MAPIQVRDLGKALLVPRKVLVHGAFQRRAHGRQWPTAVALRQDPGVAAAPAKGPIKRVGSRSAAARIPSQNVDSVMFQTRRLQPILCIHVPRSDTQLPAE